MRLVERPRPVSAGRDGELYLKGGDVHGNLDKGMLEALIKYPEQMERLNLFRMWEEGGRK